MTETEDAIDDIGREISQGAADLATKLARVMERERDALGEFGSLIILAAPAYLAEIYAKRSVELGKNPVSAAFLGIVEAPLDRALEAVGGGRIGRNRDMWKSQCERQAERLTKVHAALRAQAHAEDANANCPDCEGIGDWAECGRCSELFGHATDLRNTALAFKLEPTP
jgi:hypothetical protein